MWLFCFRPEITLLAKFGAKNQNCQFKLKYDTETNWNMQNSIFCFRTELPLFGQIGPIIKIVSLSWYSASRLIWISRIQWSCSLFPFTTYKFCPNNPFNIFNVTSLISLQFTRKDLKPVAFLVVFVTIFIVFPWDLLSQKCKVKTNMFILFFPLDVQENTF